jgi:hypothetical protein
MLSHGKEEVDIMDFMLTAGNTGEESEQFLELTNGPTKFKIRVSEIVDNYANTRKQREIVYKIIWATIGLMVMLTIFYSICICLLRARKEEVET